MFRPLIALSILASGVLADDQLATRARLVLREHCSECHNGVGSAGGDADFLDRDQLLSDGYIDTDDPGESYILQRIEDRSMPPLAQRQHRPVTAAETATLRRWITEGAAAWPTELADRRRIDLHEVYGGVRDFLLAKDEVDRPHFRFFTLHYQYNNLDLTASDLRLYRAALAKSLNSLSWSQDIVLPMGVPLRREGNSDVPGKDPQVVLAVDLRLLADIENHPWSEGRQWEMLSREYPYGVSYVNRGGSIQSKHQENVRRLIDPSGRVLLPIIRLDWFIATATRPPLYHDLLDLPTTEQELLSRLNVNPHAAVKSPTSARIARAGFTKSGVSDQNRLLERLTSRHGAYWKSYDFLPSTKRGNLRRFPLGPLELFPAGQHPHPDQAFAHDGGEVIFELPNGLHAYLLIDGKGNRIDAGPIEVVSDKVETSGTPAIVNGVSCMACHKQGMINFVDEIRESEAVFGEAQELVRRLHPAQDEMNRLINRDRTRYVRALELAMGGFLLDGLESGQSVTDYSDPIGEVSRRYRSLYLDGDSIARELNLSDPQTLRQQLGVQAVRELGLTPVLSGAGVIGRAEWEASDGVSLMQETAAALGLTPIR